MYAEIPVHCHRNTLTYRHGVAISYLFTRVSLPAATLSVDRPTSTPSRFSLALCCFLVRGSDEVNEEGNNAGRRGPPRKKLGRPLFLIFVLIVPRFALARAAYVRIRYSSSLGRCMS